MGRFLVVTWDGAGNLVSTLGIASRLVQQGHDVRLLGHPSIEERCGNHGWRLRPFEHTRDFDSVIPFDLDAEIPVLSEELWFSADVARDVTEALEQEPADVLLADCMLIGALSAGEALGLPTAALFHTAFAPFRGGPLVELMAPALPAANATRTELGLHPVESIAQVHDATSLNLVALPSEFEPDMPMPGNVRHVGPILDGPALMSSSDEVTVEDGPQPVVVLSMSTSFQGQTATLQALVDALSTLPVRVVMTTGPAVDPDSIRAPGNAQVVRFVSHAALLPTAAIVVTHCGLGTAMNALAHGVPMVCVPMGRDQFFNAAMVEALGAGRSIAMDADATTIRDAVRSVLDDGTSREGAKRMASVIAGYGGAADAVSALEQLVPAR